MMKSNNLRDMVIALLLIASAGGLLFNHSRVKDNGLTPITSPSAQVVRAETPATTVSTAAAPVAQLPVKPVEPISTKGLSTTVGRVTKISDGDTLHAQFVNHNGEPLDLKIRLYGINTPESNAPPGVRKDDFQIQPFSLEAKAFLAEKCPLGSFIRMESKGKDRYGRTLAVIYNAKNENMCLQLIEAGLAKAYFLRAQKNDPLKEPFTSAENRAKERKIGIWSLPEALK